ncbi:leucyl/phenylalanyl-tRNA--protein transferase [Pseudoxanthomonas spadix BD-a59]|uniref:Leucyl/phenylalanyl-tRNA--protein transferase n=1 Tax=Pseudoxanthomonas spadix (strain BD-a59) TaxID=1045855 RepID=G7UWM7_PSEUP|nr:leucyl/phenylalanyl-tRNA--protein transferase [Pseudoxanthomonas spadix]AER56534.1 leucyl/phenylalanyl-tRNA--protein transferase [Pseudoxanthomonas spadix BD-a59]
MRRRLPFLLDPSADAPFPDPRLALREPDGLLAIGGDLEPQRLLNAYRAGVFPWYSQGQPLLWWSPDPRTVFGTDRVHLSARFRRQLRTSNWVLRADTAFAQVMSACAHAPRPGQDGTWITPRMLDAYTALHRLGHAHSMEVWDGQALVGGIYGVAIGQMFFGESMFSAVSGGSKAALAGLARILAGWGWPLIDAQVDNDHLRRMGAEQWRRERFLALVDRQVALDAPAQAWTARIGDLAASTLAGV